MNYTEIKALALSYSDRDDVEVSDRIDDFLKIVEARVNRKLKTMDMSTRLDIPTVTDQDYYDLPADFGGLREIKFREGDSDTTLHFATPQFIDGVKGIATAKTYYNIVGNQIRISPVKETGNNIEIVYYKRVPGLTTTNTTNWLGDSSPDCYTFGLLVEISSFVKDANAKTLWDDRFKEAINDIEYDDAINRWSGTPLQVQLG